MVWLISSRSASTECRTIRERTSTMIHTGWFLISPAEINQVKDLVERAGTVVLGAIRIANGVAVGALAGVDIKIGIAGDRTVGVPGAETRGGTAIAVMTDGMIGMIDGDEPGRYVAIIKTKMKCHNGCILSLVVQRHLPRPRGSARPRVAMSHAGPVDAPSDSLGCASVLESILKIRKFLACDIYGVESVLPKLQLHPALYLLSSLPSPPFRFFLPPTSPLPHPNHNGCCN